MHNVHKVDDEPPTLALGADNYQAVEGGANFRVHWTLGHKVQCLRLREVRTLKVSCAHEELE